MNPSERRARYGVVVGLDLEVSETKRRLVRPKFIETLRNRSWLRTHDAGFLSILKPSTTSSGALYPALGMGELP